MKSHSFIAVAFTQCRNTSPGIQSVTVSTTLTLRFFSHFLDSLGLPLTVLCHTTGKFVVLAKFCVTAIVSSRFSTTCHQPPGTNIVSPGRCSTSSWKNLQCFSKRTRINVYQHCVVQNSIMWLYFWSARRVRHMLKSSDPNQWKPVYVWRNVVGFMA